MEQLEALRAYPQMSKRDIAIERIKMFCSNEKPYLAFSGGKDSQSVYHLTLEALGLGNFDAHFNSSLEPPELKQFIRRDYPLVVWDKCPEFNFYNKIVEKGFPLRRERWCCEYMKEWGGSGRMVITGLRSAESVRRRNFGVVEHRGKSRLMPEPKVLINPIIDWTSRDVWGYLQSIGVDYCGLYDEGASGRYRGDGIFRRLGCVLCPMETVRRKNIDLARWPKMAQAWRNAFHRRYEYCLQTGNKSVLRWKDADEMFYWYVNEPESIPKEQLCFVFE